MQMWQRLQQPLPLIFWWLVATALGAIHAWAARHEMNPDGIHYLDLSDAFLQGNWEIMINAGWSPLYPLLLGISRWIVRPSPYWEFATAHATNLILYLLTLGAFQFFLRQLIFYYRCCAEKGVQKSQTSLPEWAWWLMGHAFFIWSSLNLITMYRLEPDMCLALFVYLVSGLLLRMRSGQQTWAAFALMGISLGLAFLAKTIMFPLAFIFLSLGLFSGRNFRKVFPKVILAFLLFCTIAGPFVVSLSNMKGRFTYGDAGKLNYAWHINGVTPLVHWQGEPPGSGIPKHPTRKIRENPAVYEFATPVGGTYPPGFDYSYWYEGVVTHFDLSGHFTTLLKALKTYYGMFIEQGGIFIGWLVLFLFSVLVRGRVNLGSILEAWPLLIPSFAVLGMYALVSPGEPRYSVPFVVLIWLGFFGGCRLPESPHCQRLVASVTVAVVLSMAIPVGHSTARAIVKGFESFISQDQSSHPQWEVANGLRQMGISPGDPVAYLRSSYRLDWARLARVKIISEIPPGDIMQFWTADDREKSEVIETFSSTGARAIIAETPPSYVSTPGWQRIGQTEYYAWILDR
ncbi:hypothetical protein MYX65_01795 [Acidobacteria bacterium AH-259-L09]|nr:hypothetical protein [Acidobacteria bacterium AH-259-L09]